MSDTVLPFWLLFLLLVIALIAGRFLALFICGWAHGAKTWLYERPGRPIASLGGASRNFSTSSGNVTTMGSWLSARFSLEGFSGLPLTIAGCCMIHSLLLVGYLANGVVSGSYLTHIDQHINLTLEPLRNLDFIRFAASLTQLGSVAAVVGLLVAVTICLWITRRRVFIPGLWLTVVGADAITYAAKYAIGRPRPDFLTFASAATPSFPSGHATGAVALYGFLAYIAVRCLASQRLRFEVVYWFWALVVLIAGSRLVLSVHYASDVLAGLMVGCLGLLAGIILTEHIRARRPEYGYSQLR